MARITTPRRVIMAGALVLAIGTPALAWADTTTVNVPGTGATQPCSVSVSQSVVLFRNPPVQFGESTNCSI